MRASLSLLKHSPSIKFVGGKHLPPSTIDNSVKAHVFSSGILPGGEGAIKVSTLPKKVTQTTSKAQQSNSYILKPSTKSYDFTSVNDLPKKYQHLAFDDLELETINQGGAGLLI